MELSLQTGHYCEEPEGLHSIEESSKWNPSPTTVASCFTCHDSRDLTALSLCCLLLLLFMTCSAVFEELWTCTTVAGNSHSIFAVQVERELQQTLKTFEGTHVGELRQAEDSLNKAIKAAKTPEAVQVFFFHAIFQSFFFLE